MADDPIRLTQYSHGAGCGCKLSPAILDRILANCATIPGEVPDLLVGNSGRDDAGALDLGDGRVLLSTTDFFMPIVDDPYDFGRIASANAISDIYAMGGQPKMAIAILGWPIEKLAPEVAGTVMEGSQAICREAGLALAGGHSIDSPEPIFGLSVNGLVAREHLMENKGGLPGDLLFLTKPLGVGILSTAEKKGLLRSRDEGLAARSMIQLNKLGPAVAPLDGVHAMTDVTGFGLLGHLSELCRGGEVNAVIDTDQVAELTDLSYYIEAGAVPGGTGRNWDSYGHFVEAVDEPQKALLCDPQTSGGLLIAVAEDSAEKVQAMLVDAGMAHCAKPIGRLESRDASGPYIQVR